MRKLFGNKEPATDIAVKEMSVVPVETNPSSYVRFGWLVILIGVGGFLLLALFAPLDKGVPVVGTVTVSGNRKAIQHQTGGIVDDILVKEGDVVKAGQVLVKMNEVQARSQAEMTRIQYYTATVQVARLTAERDGKKAVVYPQEIEHAKSDPRVASSISTQNQLFASRQGSLRNELSAYDENIAGMKAQMRGLEESRDSKKDQLRFLKEQLDGMRDLAKDGYVARNRLLDVERAYSQVSGAISEDIGNIGKIQRQITETTLRRVQRQDDYQKEVRTQLADSQRDADALMNRLAAQDFELQNVLVKAPVDGTVVGLNVFTRGGVVAPGSHMMDLVPSEDSLVIEGQIPVNLIDQVHTGLSAELNFVAFNKNWTPRVMGVVTQVSADRLIDEKNGQPYYKMKAAVSPEGMKALAHLQVRPGMPVEIFVKAGERTLMSYLLKPVFDRAHSALGEE